MISVILINQQIYLISFDILSKTNITRTMFHHALVFLWIIAATRRSAIPRRYTYTWPGLEPRTTSLTARAPFTPVLKISINYKQRSTFVRRFNEILQICAWLCELFNTTLSFDLFMYFCFIVTTSKLYLNCRIFKK